MRAVKRPVFPLQARRGPAQLVGDQGLDETVLAEIAIVYGRVHIRQKDWVFSVRDLNQFVEELLVVPLDNCLFVGRFLSVDFQVAGLLLFGSFHQGNQLRAVGQRVVLLRLLASGDLLQLFLVHLVVAAAVSPVKLTSLGSTEWPCLFPRSEDPASSFIY